MKKFRLNNIVSFGEKLAITSLFVVSNLCVHKVGFLPWGVEDFDIMRNILFPLSHANWFHLACNLWCVWLLRPPYYIVSAVIISFLCSLLPEPFIHEPIMGMSGIIFAVVGTKYGFIGDMSKAIKSVWLFFVITAFIPNVACLYHFYCFSAGFMWGWTKGTMALWHSMKTK